MCLEDFKLGRRMGMASGQGAYNAATPNIVIPANRLRVALIISALGGGNLFFGFDNTVLASNGWMILPGLQRPIFFDIRIHGELVQRAWWCISSAGSGNIAYWETTLPADLESEFWRN